MPRHSTAAVSPAYSYIRFSSPGQSEGDSLRRQTADVAAWCGKNGVTLDTATTLHDLGKSAFTGKHRTNPDRHALAAFLKLVEQGKVPRGSFLVIENLDRLSREHIRPALTLLLNLIEAGIRVVQLKPVEMVFDERVEPMALMMAIMELSRGHGESALKSERVGGAWADKRNAARAGRPQPAKREDRVNGMSLLTHTLPAWVLEHGGKLVADPGRAAVVRRIFLLAAAGYGVPRIIRTFTEEGVPALGKSGRWVKSYVAKILTDRRALGEYQPCLNRDPDGEPIANYYPAVVTEGEWDAAQGGRAQRRKMPGRAGEHCNIFAGLLKNARDGEGYYAITRPGGRRVLINTSGADRGGRSWAFDLGTFEAAVLSCLKEIDPHAILNGDQGPDETLALSALVERAEASIAALGADMDEYGESPFLLKRLRGKEAELKALNERLVEARRKAAHPLSEAWGSFRSLAATLADAADPADARVRLRSAFRRMIDRVMVLVVPRGRDRMCAAQVWFAGGKKQRSYLIMRRPPKANAASRTEGGWWVRSFTDVVGEADFDLRKRADAKALERALSALTLHLGSDTD